MLNGTRIREAREALGYSQEGLAEALAVAEVTVWRWENRPPRRIDFHTAGRLADALEIPVADLFCDAPAPPVVPVEPVDDNAPANASAPAKENDCAPAGARGRG